LATNNTNLIEAELRLKIPEVMKSNGYFLHSDHSIPSTVDYSTYKYFIAKGLEIGTYR
jgi:uroporphyrinogen decarboxylase